MEGKGLAAIKTVSGTKLLKNVLYVPNIEQNLMSVGQLVGDGFSLLFKDSLCVIRDCKGVELVTVAMKNKSFPLYLDESSHFAHISIEDQSSLMHKRLGHCSYTTLGEITRHGLILDMLMVTKLDCVCEVCEQGKSSRASFSNDSVKRAK